MQGTEKGGVNAKHKNAESGRPFGARSRAAHNVGEKLTRSVRRVLHAVVDAVPSTQQPAGADRESVLKSGRGRAHLHCRQVQRSGPPCRACSSRFTTWNSTHVPRTSASLCNCTELGRRHPRSSARDAVGQTQEGSIFTSPLACRNAIQGLRSTTVGGPNRPREHVGDLLRLRELPSSCPALYAWNQ